MPYPNTLDNLPANHIDAVQELILAEHVNRLDRAVNAMQGELGLLPKGGFASVKARLDDLAAQITAITGTGGGIPANTGTTKGDLIAYTGASATTRIPLGTAGADGASLVSDSSVSSGWRVAPSGADYNLLQNGTIVTGSGITQAAAQANSVAVQAVLDAAAAQGRPVLMPPVTVEVYDPIRWPNNTHLKGFGKGRSIFKINTNLAWNAAGTAEFFRNQTAAGQNITLESIEFDGNWIARGGTIWSPIGNSLLQIRGDQTTYFKSVRYLNLTVHNAAIGGAFIWTDGFLVQGCEVYDTARDGMSAIGRPSKNGRWIGNRIYNNGDDCIGINSGSASGGGDPNRHENMVVAGNVFGPHTPYPVGGAPPTYANYGGHAVACSGIIDCTIANNTCHRNGIGGISVLTYGEGKNAEQITITGNVITLPGAAHIAAGTITYGSGIAVHSQDAGNINNVVVSNNVIQQAMWHSIKLERLSTGTVNYVRIAGNIITGPGGGTTEYHQDAAGIGVMGGACNFVQVDSNIIRDLRGKAIDGNSLVCTQWQITNNLVASVERGATATGGAAIDITNFTEWIVSGNQVRDFQGVSQATRNQGSALGIAGTAGGLIANNRFQASSRNASALSGTPGSFVFQHANVANDGSFKHGDATAGNL